MAILDSKNFTDNKCSENSLEELNVVSVYANDTLFNLISDSSPCKNLQKDMEIIANWAKLKIFKSDNFSDETKRLLISIPGHRPKGPFPKDPSQQNRSFNETYYYSTSNFGPVPRLWICYSSTLDAVYCHPCCLFSSIKSQWQSGIKDWKNLSQKIKMHSSSQHHIEACAVLELWKKNKTIHKKAENEIRYRASFWQMVLERLFHITLMLSKNSLAFRGHLEGFTEDYNGNFLSQVQLLSNYDSVMKQILEMPSGSIRYLSPTTQNELIHCLGKTTTQDITKRDQFSVIIRHVHIVRNVNQEPTHFRIKETFLGFYDLKDHSAEGMTNQVLTLLKEAHIPIENIKRWDLLSIFTGESEVTLKKLNPTRWSGRLQSLTAIKVRFTDILKALTEIILKSTKKEEREEALQIKKKMGTFDFVFICVFLFKVMCEVNYASKTLQKHEIDLEEASEVLKHVREKLNDIRKSYEQIKLKAEELARKWDIETNFQSKRQPVKKRHFDELASDHRFQNRVHLFKMNVFYFVLDKISVQIEQRFSGMQTVKNLFCFLEPKNIINLPDTDILEMCENVSKKYSKVISPLFGNQFLQAVSLLKTDLTSKM
nr:uncharacterized protein LOC105843268 [Hydra vulgaris]